MKTDAAHFDRLATLVNRLHPYDLPAVTAHLVVLAGPGVPEWVAEETPLGDDAAP